MPLTKVRASLAALGLAIVLLPPAVAALHSIRLVTHGTWSANSRTLDDQFICIGREIDQQVPAGTTVFIKVNGAAYGSFETLWRSRLPELSWPRLRVTSSVKHAAAVVSVVRQPHAACGGVALAVTWQ